MTLSPSLRQTRLAELRQTARGGSDPGFALDNPSGIIELCEYAEPKTVLELGSDRGVSTEVFLLYCEHVTAVDPWDYTRLITYPETGPVDGNFLAAAEPRYQQFMARCGGYKNLTVVRGFSPDVLADMKPASFDMVYLDGVHIYQPVIDDIRASHQLVKPGGWIAGHDYYRPDNETNVIRAVNELLGEPLRVFSDFSWVFRRPAKLLG